MRTNHVLIDFENVHVKSLELLKGEHFRVMVFLGPKNTKLPVDLVLAMQAFGTRGEYVMLESPGANALDFHVAFHLGRLAAEDPGGFFHIISKDTGFDPLIQHLKARKVFSARSPSIEEMPCFRAASHVSPAASPAHAPPHEQRVADTGRFDELCKMAIAQLVAMKRARPGKLSTLHSTIQAKLGKDVSGSTVDMVCSELVKRGLVKVAGQRLAYAIPD
ncbi:MAG TPA: PIN domain-containing protein [Thauera sp.]|uniref:PIN domain-containing protein n=1 Tax=Thauera sp. TaxID=1905334 RepID=UPI002C813109|nr:PIN domain-containing protein [Thauera sp.]HRP26597.1 PIN domain-containing protein [Thauera sp.]HRP66646.1 PIN domain-containing protein [Thauera sp.]